MLRAASALTSPASSAAAIAWSDPARAAAFAAWLAAVGPRHAVVASSLRPASADASFRRYLRADRASGGSVIVMDAPPPREDVRPFLHVAALIAAAGLHAPRVLEADVANGFVLLSGSHSTTTPTGVLPGGGTTYYAQATVSAFSSPFCALGINVLSTASSTCW